MTIPGYRDPTPPEGRRAEGEGEEAQDGGDVTGLTSCSCRGEAPASREPPLTPPCALEESQVALLPSVCQTRNAAHCGSAHGIPYPWVLLRCAGVTGGGRAQSGAARTEAGGGGPAAMAAGSQPRLEPTTCMLAIRGHEPAQLRANGRRSGRFGRGAGGDRRVEWAWDLQGGGGILSASGAEAPRGPGVAGAAVWGKRASLETPLLFREYNLLGPSRRAGGT